MLRINHLLKLLVICSQNRDSSVVAMSIYLCQQIIGYKLCFNIILFIIICMVMLKYEKIIALTPGNV